MNCEFPDERKLDRLESAFFVAETLLELGESQEIKHTNHTPESAVLVVEFASLEKIALLCVLGDSLLNIEFQCAPSPHRRSY